MVRAVGASDGSRSESYVRFNAENKQKIDDLLKNYKEFKRADDYQWREQGYQLETVKDLLSLFKNKRTAIELQDIEAISNMAGDIRMRYLAMPPDPNQQRVNEKLASDWQNVYKLDQDRTKLFEKMITFAEKIKKDGKATDAELTGFATVISAFKTTIETYTKAADAYNRAYQHELQNPPLPG